MKKYIISYIVYERGNLYDITKAFINNFEIDAISKEEAYKEFIEINYFDKNYIRILNIIELDIDKVKGDEEDEC